MITILSRLWKISLLALGLTLAGLAIQLNSQKPAQIENSSVISFMSAMETWDQVSQLSRLFSASGTSQRDFLVARTLLEKTVWKLRACDRAELEKIYPGWGANRDLFLSTAYGYLESLERADLRTRDFQESQRKMEILSIWMDRNWKDLQRQLAKGNDRKQWPSTLEFSL